VPTTTRDAAGRSAAVPLARAAFALLALAAVAALFITQELKHQPALVLPPPDAHPANGVAIGRPFATGDDGVARVAIFSFRLSRRDAVTVSIRSEPSGAFVAYARAWVGGRFPTPVTVLARNVEMHRYTRLDFIWNGRGANGSLAPAGNYEVQVQLEQQDRTTLIPRFTVKLEYPHR